MPTQAVCFDLGGVVAQISTSWAEILTRLGLPIPATITAQTHLSEMPLFDGFQMGGVAEAEYMGCLARYLGLSESDAKRVHAGILIGPYPGVQEIVRELNANGTATGCLSNTNAPHWIDLALNGRFPAVVDMRCKIASFEIDASKPSSRAFEIYSAIVDLPPASLLLFDDSLENCQAAIKLGWKAVHIDPLAGPAKQMRCALMANGVL